eukprot:1677720-Amphidinium_carterae.1
MRLDRKEKNSDIKPKKGFLDSTTVDKASFFVVFAMAWCTHSMCRIRMLYRGTMASVCSMSMTTGACMPSQSVIHPHGSHPARLESNGPERNILKRVRLLRIDALAFSKHQLFCLRLTCFATKFSKHVPTHRIAIRFQKQRSLDR